MASKTWSAVDDYIVERLIPADAALEAALANNVRHGLPAIVSTLNRASACR